MLRERTRNGLDAARTGVAVENGKNRTLRIAI